MSFWKKINMRWTQEELATFKPSFRVIYLLFPLVVYFFVGDAVEILLWALLNIVLSNADAQMVENAVKYSESIKGMIYGVGLVASLAILSTSGRNEIVWKNDKEIKSKINFTNVIMLIVLGLASSIGLNYIFNFIGLTSASRVYDEISKAQYSVNIFTGLILYGICSPIIEEVIFRGIIYNRLKRMFPLTVSIITSAILFGMFHGNIVQAIYGFIMGCLIAWCYEKYDSFIAPVVIHVTANVGVYLLTYYVWK